MLYSHLPILIVALPLAATPLCALFRHRELAWWIAQTVSLLVLLMSCQLMLEVWENGVVSYELGGWPPPLGIAYRLDSLNIFFVFLLAAISAVMVFYARLSVAQELRRAQGSLFYALWLACLAGMLGIVVSDDLFNIFVFLEIASLSAYALVACSPDIRAVRASYRYLVLGSVGSIFFLAGVGYLYMVTGTLNLSDMQSLLPSPAHTRAVLAAVAFISAGVALKAALFPLHAWLPDVYTHAPSPVSAFLSATSSKVALYLLLKIVLLIFGARLESGFNQTLLLLSAGGILYASVLAIQQNDCRRMMAYSSVAHIAYITAGLSLLHADGIRAGLLALFSHALIKGGLFLALGCIFYRCGACRIEQLHGLGRRMPWTAAAIVAGGLSLIGVPLSSGFIAKWYLFHAFIATEQWWMVLVMAAGSALAIAYVWRLLAAIWFRPVGQSVATVGEAPLGLLLPAWALIVLNFYVGMHAQPLLSLAHDAASGLF